MYGLPENVNVTGGSDFTVSHGTEYCPFHDLVALRTRSMRAEASIKAGRAKHTVDRKQASETV